MMLRGLLVGKRQLYPSDQLTGTGKILYKVVRFGWEDVKKSKPNINRSHFRKNLTILNHLSINLNVRIAWKGTQIVKICSDIVKLNTATNQLLRRKETVRKERRWISDNFQRHVVLKENWKELRLSMKNMTQLLPTLWIRLRIIEVFFIFLCVNSDDICRFAWALYWSNKYPTRLKFAI